MLCSKRPLVRVVPLECLGLSSSWRYDGGIRYILLVWDTSIVSSLSHGGNWMWRLVSDWDDISSTALEDSTAYVLDFADGSLLLLSVDGESSTDSVQESSDRIGSTGSVCVVSENN